MSRQSTAAELLGTPLLTIYNTARRWWTVKNYDLVIYDRAVLIVLGIRLDSLVREMRRRREARHLEGTRGLGARISAANDERSATIATTPLPVLLAADPGNRLVGLDEIQSARLSRRLGISTLRLELSDGIRLRFLWTNASWRGFPRYEEAAETLRSLLPGRFRAADSRAHRRAVSERGAT
jgi:hypothetical protein